MNIRTITYYGHTPKQAFEIGKETAKLGAQARLDPIRVEPCIYFMTLGYVEIPFISRKQNVKADTRKGVAVEYLQNRNRHNKKEQGQTLLGT